MPRSFRMTAESPAFSILLASPIRSDCQVSRLSTDGEEFLASHRFQLRQGPPPIPRVCFAARRDADGPSPSGSWHDPRICLALARPWAGKKLHCAQARGAAFLFQVLRARGKVEGEPRAPGAHTQTAEAHPFGAFRGRDERVA